MKDKEEQRCRLFEIEQYICEIEDKENARVRCYPLPRIFRLCQGRPAVEVTALVDVNPKTGEITIPENISEILPRGKPWRDCSSPPEYPNKKDL